MNAIDGTEHYEGGSENAPPSLLVVVLDTNPHAWSALSSTLPLSKAVANLLVFINAHLAFNNANRVAVIASHCQRTRWLYPAPPFSSETNASTNGNNDTSSSTSTSKSRTRIQEEANKYRPFALIEEAVLRNLRQLFDTTTPAELQSTNTTLIAGALTLALSYINKTTLSLTGSNGSNTLSTSSSTNPNPTDTSASGVTPDAAVLNSRILILSTSGDLASQYIPIMNLIFASQHSRIPIDILKLAGDTVLLQQASYTTSGVFLSAATSPSGPVPNNLLPHLLFALLPDAVARQHLIPPTAVNVDFRAACFCHRRVVDVGFVCSICLSIFCEVLADGTCLTCGTKLSVKGLGGPAVLDGEQQAPKKKKKKRKDVLENGPATAT